MPEFSGKSRFSRNEKVLKPHVLQPARGYNKDRDAFVKFLQDGLKEYKARAGK